MGAIEFCQGDLFESGCEALVNPVNTRGVSGKGLALRFKQEFPLNYELYAKACREDRLLPGGVFVVDVSNCKFPSVLYILNAATKDDWRNPSTMQMVRWSIQHIRDAIYRFGIRSIAIPALGCGCGGLEWKQVKRALIEILSDVSASRIKIYEPTCNS